MLSSLAVNHALKETGIMQEITKLTESQFDEIDNAVPLRPEIVGVSETTEVSLTPAELEQFQSIHSQMGLGDEVSIEDMVEATKTPIAPLTKKQRKRQKYMMKNLQSQMRSYQRQGQASHIMNKLFQHSIQTPEQARQVHATQLAKAELTAALGARQAEAFFQAKPDTKCHDFFPKVTVDANPTLMTDIQGKSRTLAQVYEYYIYKHFMVLTAAAEAATPELTTEVDWAAIGDVPKYVPFTELPIGEPITLTKEQVSQFTANVAATHDQEGNVVPTATAKYLEDLKEKAI